MLNATEIRLAVMPPILKNGAHGQGMAAVRIGLPCRVCPVNRTFGPMHSRRTRPLLESLAYNVAEAANHFLSCDQQA